MTRMWLNLVSFFFSNCTRPAVCLVGPALGAYSKSVWGGGVWETSPGVALDSESSLCLRFGLWRPVSREDSDAPFEKYEVPLPGQTSAGPQHRMQSVPGHELRRVVCTADDVGSVTSVVPWRGGGGGALGPGPPPSSRLNSEAGTGAKGNTVARASGTGGSAGSESRRNAVGRANGKQSGQPQLDHPFQPLWPVTHTNRFQPL